MNKVRALRNHIESSSRVMIVAASVIIVCLVCGFSFYVAREGKNTGGKVTGEFMAFASEYQDVDLQLYDGMDVSGREVRNVITKCADDANVSVRVITKANTLGVVYTTATFAAEGHVDYINDTALFTGRVTRNANDVINLITFTQQ